MVAVGRSILTVVWQLLSDPDAQFHDRLGAERAKRNQRSGSVLVRRVDLNHSGASTDAWSINLGYRHDQRWCSTPTRSPRSATEPDHAGHDRRARLNLAGVSAM